MFPTRYLGLNSECKEQLELENRFILHKFVDMPNRKIGIEVTQQGEKHTLLIEQIVAFFLTRIKKFYENADLNSKEFVITVPSYFTNVERQALLDACDIAGIKCLRLINESTAIALQYGFFRKKDLDAKQDRKVVFVDVGHSKTTVSIASFVQEKTKMIIHRSRRNLGARDFDWQILQKIGADFAKQYGADPRKNTRCVLRMLEGVEKARKQLSSVPDVNINIEYLLEEEDLNAVLKRDEFEAMIDPYLRDFTDLLKETLADSGKFQIICLWVCAPHAA